MKAVQSVSILLLTLACISGCGWKQFGQDRAELLEEKAKRKAEYQEQKAKEKASADTAVVEETMTENLEPNDEGTRVFSYPDPSDSLFLQYERTPCFGRCPVFKIKIYEGGYVTYQGVNFVEYMGYYQSRIDEQDIATLYAAIADADYFALEERYDNDRVTDLPSKIFRVKAMGKDKRIVARYEVPQQLRDFADHIEEMFEDTQWELVPDENRQ